MEFPAPLKSKILENKRGAIIFKHPVCECVCIDFSRLLSIKCELPRKLTLDEPCLTLFGEKP